MTSSNLNSLFLTLRLSPGSDRVRNWIGRWFPRMSGQARQRIRKVYDAQRLGMPTRKHVKI